MTHETYTGPERRQAPRVRFTNAGQMSISAVQGHAGNETITFVNLSESGACVKTTARLKPGFEMIVDFTLPGLLAIQCKTKAKVVWTSMYAGEKGYLTGIIFGSLSPFALTALRTFLLQESKKGTEIKSH